MNYKDSDYLKEECLDGRQLGFTGKVVLLLWREFRYSLCYSQQAIHPSQIDIIQSSFVPTSGGEFAKTNIAEDTHDYY